MREETETNRLVTDLIKTIDGELTTRVRLRL